MGDVLIGADGASSRMRRQLLPHAERVETGILAISGKIAMTEAVRQRQFTSAAVSSALASYERRLRGYGP